MRLHPYEDEITLLLEKPADLPKFAFNNLTDLRPSFVWVSTEHQLQSLAEILNKEQGFAVDTEQHSLRSSLGFTALMQVSPILIILRFLYAPMFQSKTFEDS